MNGATNTRQRLIESARQLMHARSYGSVGVKDICDAAGVQKGSFYHFFASKQELALAVLDNNYLASKELVFANAFDVQYLPLERIQRLVDGMYTLQHAIKEQTGKTLGCPYGNMISELAAQDEIIRQYAADLLVRIELEIKQCLDEAVRKGELQGLDTAATARAMFAYLEGLMLIAKVLDDPEVITQLGKAVLKLRVENKLPSE